MPSVRSLTARARSFGACSIARPAAAGALPKRSAPARPPGARTTPAARRQHHPDGRRHQPATLGGALGQLARQVHSSLARAIQPFHGPNDGDVLYAVTTDEVNDRALDPTTLGVVASELAWDAALSLLPAAGLESGVPRP